MSPPPTPKRAPAATMPCSSKRRRLTTPPEAAASTETWASLPQDLLQLIGWRVLAGDLRDYVRVRAVCSHRNANTVRPRGSGVSDPSFHPRSGSPHQVAIELKKKTTRWVGMVRIAVHGQFWRGHQRQRCPFTLPSTSEREENGHMAAD